MKHGCRRTGSATGLATTFVVMAVMGTTVGDRRAVAAPPVQLDFDDGVTLAVHADVRHIVELNLRAPHGGSGEHITHVRISPTPGRPSRVNIQVDDPITEKTLGRTVNLLALGPNGATRLLALAVVELVTASWSELELHTRPAGQPDETPAPSVDDERSALDTVRQLEIVRPLEPVSRRTELAAFGIVEGSFGGIGVLAGGGVRIVPELPHHLALPIDVVFEHGNRDYDNVGDVAIDALAADLALAYHGQWSRFGLRAGGGVRAGAARFGGTPHSTAVGSSTVWAPWGGPIVEVGGVFAATQRLSLELLVEGGYAIARTSARVAGTDEISIQGPWVGAALCVGFMAGR